MRSPLPHQTVHADFPHTAFARAYCTEHSQVEQSQLSEVLVNGKVVGWLPRSLTPASKMTVESTPNIPIHLAEGDSGMSEPVVVSPALEVPVELADQLWQRDGTVSCRGHVPELVQFTSHCFGAGFQSPIVMLPSL